jgi:hypothetical protein
LLRAKETKVFQCRARERERRSIVSMLQNYTNTTRGLCDLMDDALLQESKTVSYRRLSRKKDENGTAWFVELRVEEVPQVERAVDMRFVTRFIGEEVHGN